MEERTMKKVYETPSVEVVRFQYKDQVVAQSGCQKQWMKNRAPADDTCTWSQIGQTNML